MDRNLMILVGRIGGVIKKGKTVNGQTYIWMPVLIHNKDGATSTSNNFEQNLNVMCYKPAVIKYLEKVNAHTGDNVIIFGFLSSFKQEIKGKEIVANAVNGIEIYIIKTKSDEEIINSQNNR